jgi:tripartite-type tricarboxylate transporter receptor subunit TctC
MQLPRYAERYGGKASRAAQSNAGEETMHRRSLLALAAVLPCPAIAQPRFPERPVRIVVPFPPGGSYDVVARLLARALQEAWPEGIVIDNRAGAGGNLGAEFVAKAPADGHTLLLWGDGLLINQALYPRRPWDALRDFAPVAKLAQSPQLLIASPDRRLDSLAALLATARTREVTYATAGIGTPGHLATELLRARTGARLVHVPYRGGAPAIADLLGGQVDLVCTGVPACLPFLADSRVLPLGVSSAQRFATLPAVPAMAETVPEVAVDTWYGLLAPAAIEPDVCIRITAKVMQALAPPATAAALQAQGFEPDSAGPAAFAALLARDAPRWAELVALSGAKVE